MAVQYQDYYQTLGVARDAPQEDIQRAYRKLARQYHPDMNKEKAAEERFRKIGEAYEVLKDAQKRKQYDALGANWKAGQEFRPPPGWAGSSRSGGRGAGGRVRTSNVDFGDLGGGGFSDFFESIFGGAEGGSPFGAGVRPNGRARPARPSRGESHEVDVTISLADAYHGTTRRISLDVVSRDEDGDESRTTKNYDVRIPAGTTEGSVIRLSGQGGPGAAGGASGDLLMRVHIAPDPRFTVSGHDLAAVVPISPWEAALGAKVQVQLLEGSATVTIPPGSQTGQKLRLRGKGLPVRAAKGEKASGTHGDVIAELRIVVPKELSDEERRLFEEMKQKSKFDPRAKNPDREGGAGAAG